MDQRPRKPAQDFFLTRVLGRPIKVITNDDEFDGKLVDSDKFVLVMDIDGSKVMIYKHAIITVEAI